MEARSVQDKFSSNIHAERVRQTSISGSYRSPGGTISSGQVLHMISERRRREKMKESFEALRSLIPPGSRVRFMKRQFLAK